MVLIAAPAMAAGVALEYFLDPRSGRRQRKLVRDRVRRTVRRRARAVGRQAQYEAGKVIGLTHAVADRHHGTPELDDVSLVRKVESELFRDRTVPKGQISINADRGIVVLRGELDDSQQIRHIENAAREICGVRDVENLLHTPGVPAPPSRPHPTSAPLAQPHMQTERLVSASMRAHPRSKRPSRSCLARRRERPRDREQAQGSVAQHAGDQQQRRLPFDRSARRTLPARARIGAGRGPSNPGCGGRHAQERTLLAVAT
jgi:BON domain